MAAYQNGDVIEYLQRRVLAAQVGTVMETRPGVVVLYCGTWIRHGEIVRIIGHSREIPAPSRIATAMLYGDVYLGRPPRRFCK